MGREIKFRAWFELQNKMVHHEVLCLSYANGEGFEFAFDESTVDANGQMEGTMNFELMQYTGLRDKNGTEIYEGDIVAVACDCDPGDYAVCTHPPVITYVGWFQDNASFELRDASGKLSDEEFSDDYQDVYEVIGNIYEHSDLLSNTVSE